MSGKPARACVALAALATVLLLSACSDDPAPTPPVGPPADFPDTPDQLMANFQAAYEHMDPEQLMVTLHPQHLTYLQQETINNFPDLGPTLDVQEEQRDAFHNDRGRRDGLGPRGRLGHGRGDLAGGRGSRNWRRDGLDRRSKGRGGLGRRLARELVGRDGQQPQLPHDEHPRVGGIADPQVQGLALPVPGLAIDPQDHRAGIALARDRRLHSRRHLARVQRVHA